MSSWSSSPATPSSAKRREQLHHEPEVVHDETIALLAAKPVARFDHSRWYWRIIDQMTFDRAKIFVILVITVAAVVVFSIEKVPHVGGFNLAAARNDDPLISSCTAPRLVSSRLVSSRLVSRVCVNE